jgi:hypothetical protein
MGSFMVGFPVIVGERVDAANRAAMNPFCHALSAELMQKRYGRAKQ